jgi:hypothetical protein
VLRIVNKVSVRQGEGRYASQPFGSSDILTINVARKAVQVCE